MKPYHDELMMPLMSVLLDLFEVIDGFESIQSVRGCGSVRRL